MKDHPYLHLTQDECEIIRDAVRRSRNKPAAFKLIRSRIEHGSWVLPATQQLEKEPNAREK